MSLIKRYPVHSLLLWFCALAYAAITCALALTRLYTFKDSLLDSGTFDQVLWNLVHHHGPLSTTNAPFNNQNWFGFHFSPILFLLVPLYEVWPSLEMPQIVQSLCFGGTGIILFHALKAAGAKNGEAWAGALLYWLNPFVLSAAVWDFHEIAFAAPLIATALWALCAKRFTAMTLALLLLMLTKEHYGLSVAGFGLLWGLRHKDWKRGGMLMTLGIAGLGVILGILMPYFGSAGHHTSVMGRYSWLGAPFAREITSFCQLMFEGRNNIPGLMYVCVLLASALMLPLAAPFYLLPAAGDLGANLLSANPMPRNIAAYHSATVIPVLVMAAYQGYRWLESRNIRPVLLQSIMALFALMFLATGLTLYPLSFWEIARLQISPKPQDQRAIVQIRALLPADAVVAQSNIGMFFAQREAIYSFPYKLEQANAVILRLENPFSTLKTEHFNIPFEVSGADYIYHVREFVQAPGWHIALWQAPWLVMMPGVATQDERTQRAQIERAIEAFGTHDATAPPASQN